MQVAIRSLSDKVTSAIYEPIQRLEDISTYIMPNGEEWSSVRDLYEYLQLAPATFTRWCNTNIEKNAFAAQQADYERINLWVETPNGGSKAAVEYAVHPDFGAKLCMVATRSARAEEVRNFFVARNKKLAAIEQAAISTAPAIPQTQAELILMIAQQGVATEKRLAEHDRQLAVVQQQVAEVAAKQTTIEEAHYTMAAWAKKNGYNRTRDQLNALGRQASKLSKEQGYSVGRVYDAKYVTVGSYHVDILAQVLPLPTSLARAA